MLYFKPIFKYNYKKEQKNKLYSHLSVRALAEYLRGIRVPVRQAYGNSVRALKPIIASKVVFDRYILSKNTLNCKIENRCLNIISISALFGTIIPGKAFLMFIT